MSAGIYRSTNNYGRACIEVGLVSGATGTASGTWYDIGGLSPFTVYTVATAATVQIHGALASAIPTGDGAVIATVTAGQKLLNNIVDIDSFALKYIKAKVSAHTGGTVTVYGYGYGKD